MRNLIFQQGVGSIMKEFNTKVVSIVERKIPPLGLFLEEMFSYLTHAEIFNFTATYHNTIFDENDINSLDLLYEPLLNRLQEVDRSLSSVISISMKSTIAWRYTTFREMFSSWANQQLEDVKAIQDLVKAQTDDFCIEHVRWLASIKKPATKMAVLENRHQFLIQLKAQAKLQLENKFDLPDKTSCFLPYCQNISRNIDINDTKNLLKASSKKRPRS